MTATICSKDVTVKEVKGYGIGVRHLQVLMLFMAMILAFFMRVNISLAIVDMTDPTKEDSFHWSVQTQSVILSSFLWGYPVLTIPAGILASRVGGMILITLCISINSVVSLLLPVASYYGGWQLVCACRGVQGIAQGFLIPSLHNIIAKWVPIEERSFLGTLIYSGGHLGIGLQNLLGGYIAEYWGWPSIFYVSGTLGAIWTVFYVYIGAASPQASRLISDEERLYIQTSLGHVGGVKKLNTPWKAIWTSLPFFALIIVHCSSNWGMWTMLTFMPSYMNQVLGVDIKSNGALSAFPYLATYMMSFILGYLSDLALRRNWLSISALRKLSNSIGFYGPAIALVGLSNSPAGSVIAAVGLITLVVGLNTCYWTGFLLVHIDMSPNFASQMMGITNFFANSVSIIAPLVIGVILTDDGDASEWRQVFYLSSAFYVLSNTFFLIFGSSERQKWNDLESKDTKEGLKKGEKTV